MTRASSSHCTKKASQQDRFPRVVHIPNPQTWQGPKQAERIPYPHKLVQCLERRNVLPPNQGEYRAGKSTKENAARLAYNVYQGFQRREQTLAVAVDLENAYNRVQWKLLMELLT